MKLYGIEAGRTITRDSKPFVSLVVCKDPKTGSANFPYVDADTLASWIPDALNTHDQLRSDNERLREALATLEKRITQTAHAFYVVGKPSALRAAFDGWKLDAEQARAALAKDGQ